MTQAMLDDIERMSRQLQGVIGREQGRVDRGGVATRNGQEVMDDAPGSRR